MAGLTDEQGQFLKTKNLATVAAIRPDGSAQLTPVWIDWDGENVVFNTAEGRYKPRYIRQNPLVSIEVLDREDPYRWISVTGPAEISEEGAEEHINELSHRYNDGRDYNYVPGEKRLIVRIRPERVTSRGL
jgi:PPOX class probable F420-dependent enzyme